jgi:hypothetical protein
VIDLMSFDSDFGESWSHVALDSDEVDAEEDALSMLL